MDRDVEECLLRDVEGVLTTVDRTKPCMEVSWPGPRNMTKKVMCFLVGITRWANLRQGFHSSYHNGRDKPS